MTSQKKAPAYDSFTVKLLAVYEALTLAEAFERKITFSTELQISKSFFVMIEKRERNFPKDEEKRKIAKMNLLDKFYVNPDYLENKSDKMFLKPPVATQRVELLDTVKFEFHAKHQKAALLKMLEEMKEQLQQKDEEIKQLKQRLSALEKK